MMAQYQNDELEYMINDYIEMGEFEDEDDDLKENSLGKHDEISDYEDDDDYVDMGKQKADTSASEARDGKDIQGIPWERMINTRDQYRESRLKQYKNYVSLSHSRSEVEKLRNLLWATSKHDVYLMHNYSVMHWSSLLQRGKEVLNVAGNVETTVKSQGYQAQSLSRVQVSCLSVKDNLIVAGGFQGELICKYLNRPGVAFCSRITTDENAITNAVDIYKSPNGSTRLMTANNDCHVRVFDTDEFNLLNQFSFPWSVNNTSVSPDGKLLAVLGDSVDCLIVDAQSGKGIGNLKGHLDYSFSSAWHPDGQILATGNQDTTCRLWDVRNLSESLAVLKGRMGAIRAIKFTSDGRYMAMAEPADFVHVFDTTNGYSSAQEIDLFGEIAGISFSPDTEALFVGVADRTYGSLLEFKSRHQYQYYNAFV